MILLISPSCSSGIFSSRLRASVTSIKEMSPLQLEIWRSIISIYTRINSMVSLPLLQQGIVDWHCSPSFISSGSRCSAGAFAASSSPFTSLKLLMIRKNQASFSSLSRNLTSAHSSLFSLFGHICIDRLKTNSFPPLPRFIRSKTMLNLMHQVGEECQ